MVSGSISLSSTSKFPLATVNTEQKIKTEDPVTSNTEANQLPKDRKDLLKFVSTKTLKCIEIIASNNHKSHVSD